MINAEKRMNMNTQFLTEILANLESQGLKRRLSLVDSSQNRSITVEGKTLLNFCSNNYLGLADDIRLKKAMLDAVYSDGVGSGASRLVCGNMAAHEKLEKLYHELEQANERLTQVDEIKTRFMAVASHEVKTPLTLIKGFLDLILDGKMGVLTDAQKQYLTLVDEAADRLHHLVDDLLDISGIELGQIRMKRHQTNLKKLLKEEIVVFKAWAGQKEIILEENIPEDLSPVFCDPDRIKEVLDNLVSNAMKYTPRKGRIWIEARDTGTGVQMDIRDTGVGIRPRDQERIFEPFQHIRKSGLEGEKSTGLGLALVKKIIDAHGGRIEVQSGEGMGSTFSIILPFRRKEPKG